MGQRQRLRSSQRRGGDQAQWGRLCGPDGGGYFPKLLQIYEADREVYEAADYFIKATDSVVWQLVGAQVRGARAVSYKALWSIDHGLPSAAYFEAVAPDFSAAVAMLGDRFETPGARAGRLTPRLATGGGRGRRERRLLRLRPGRRRRPPPGPRVGDRNLDLRHDRRPARDPPAGYPGVVRDGILPGLFGYEAGQPAVGDMLGWFVGELLGTPTAARSARHDALEREAGALAPGSTGLMVPN